MLYKYDLGQIVLLLHLIFLFFHSRRVKRESSRERAREREEVDASVYTAACGEDSELKVAALQLVIVIFLCIVIVGV